jgi:hypothetical protein
MRAVLVMCACLLAACSTESVRCERHLTPINPSRRPIADAPSPGHPEGSSARSPVASQPSGTPRTKAAAKSVSVRSPAPETEPEGRHEP